MPMKRILQELKFSNLISTYRSEKNWNFKLFEFECRAGNLLGVTALGDIHVLKIEEKVRENQREKLRM